jgi:hypothetical protein
MTYEIAATAIRLSIPLCALGAGTLFGLIAYVKTDDYLSRGFLGFLIGLGSGFALAALMFIALVFVVAGDDAGAAFGDTLIFIPASAVTGVLWSAGYRRRRKSLAKDASERA